MEIEEDDSAGRNSAAAGGDSGAAGQGEDGVVQAQAEEAAADEASAATGEDEGGAGRASGQGGGRRSAARRRGSRGGPWPESWSTGGLLKVCLVCTEVVWPHSPLPDKRSDLRYIVAVGAGTTGEVLWKLTGGAPQPTSEGARVGSGEGGVGQAQAEEGRGAGCMEERLPRRSVTRSVPYLRAFKGAFLFIL